MTERKKILLRLDPAVHDAIAKWAADELRSTNAQIEFLLRRSLGDAGRMPGNAGRPARRGRPPKTDSAHRPTPEAESEPDESDKSDESHKSHESESDSESGGGDGGDRDDPGDPGNRGRGRGDTGDLGTGP